MRKIIATVGLLGAVIIFLGGGFEHFDLGRVILLYIDLPALILQIGCVLAGVYLAFPHEEICAPVRLMVKPGSVPWHRIKEAVHVCTLATWINISAALFGVVAGTINFVANMTVASSEPRAAVARVFWLAQASCVILYAALFQILISIMKHNAEKCQRLEGIRSLGIVFEDLMLLNDEKMKELVAAVENEIWAGAFRISSTDLKERVYRCMDSVRSENIEALMERNKSNEFDLKIDFEKTNKEIERCQALVVNKAIALFGQHLGMCEAERME